MNGLKQRIIGALVLISIAVIFLPMIFDKPHQQRESQIIALPVPPDVPAATFKAPTEPTYQIIDQQGNEQNNIQSSFNSPTTQSSTGQSSTVESSNVQPSANQTNTPAKVTPADKASDKETKVAENSSSTRAVSSQNKATKKPAKQAQAKPLASPIVSNMALFKNSLMIQVGTFNNKKNAINLRQRVIDMKLDGHIAVYQSEGKTMWQVFSGPYANKQKAESVQKQLDQKFKIKSIIKQF